MKFVCATGGSVFDIYIYDYQMDTCVLQTRTNRPLRYHKSDICTHRAFRNGILLVSSHPPRKKPTPTKVSQSKNAHSWDNVKIFDCDEIVASALGTQKKNKQIKSKYQTKNHTNSISMINYIK